MQSASTVAMVRPAAFGFNEQTAANNFFQDKAGNQNGDLQALALKEFDEMVALLRENKIEVIVLQDSIEPPKPDAIFPNNWFSCKSGTINIFPMYAPNRRLEKRDTLIKMLAFVSGAQTVTDHSSYEEQQQFLEGTGSMIFDHDNNIVYACISGRTNKMLFEKYALEQQLTSVAFDASDENEKEIYHTNVMMCIGSAFAVVCSDAIKKVSEKEMVINKLIDTGHEVIDISFEQMKKFAGNMLELQDKDGKKLLLMSRSAQDSLTASQLDTLARFCSFIVPDVSHIEKASGGSVRCMVAEIFN